jgi:hypothetical protein
MKRSLLILLIFSACLSTWAQEDKSTANYKFHGKDTSIVSLPIEQSIHSQTTPIESFNPEGAYNNERKDSLHLPSLNQNGQVPYTGIYPYNWYGWYNWDLHEGLNVNLGASVFAQFGHNAYHGAGFAQNISAMYAIPLTNKLSLAVGGYLNNVSWAHDSYRDAGFSAVLGYKFDEHWEAYLYGQKSLVNNHIPLPIYDMNNVGDRIGAMVKYNFNPSFSIEVSVEADKRPNNGYWYNDTYNYPLPKVR